MAFQIPQLTNGYDMKNCILILAALISTNVMAKVNSVTSQCGNFTLVAKVGELTTVNGETVTSQKITEIGKNGLRVQMTLMPARDGNMYGFEYIRPDGDSKRRCQQRVKSDPLTVTTNGLILIHLAYSGLASAITPAFRFCFSR
ncbi:hypothetical protein QNH14_13205 [Apirhabdus apintestini]|nr:hypothetical protein QNH14_13205 [Enterobacteriaceae bacterium CA-0114]